MANKEKKKFWQIERNVYLKKIKSLKEENMELKEALLEIKYLHDWFYERNNINKIIDAHLR